ncbi:MAG: alkaline phosphatase [Treponema sp.]|jgi:alkaline phosphatase|nr:alkaline phosphatase [Treponema sp.]
MNVLKKLSKTLLILISIALLFSCKNENETAKAGNRSVSGAKPKYVFMFIGDGMSHVQANVARVFLGNNTKGEVEISELSFTSFPVNGIATTQDSTSFCPDSASTATSFSCGVKTHSGVIGKLVDKTKDAKNLSEYFKEQGWKVGIVSTVTLNHATPAAYYAHVANRGEYYNIGLQLANSGFDYFAGGAIYSPTDKNKDKKDIYDILREKGYTVTKTQEEFNALTKNSGKIYAESPILQDSGSMPYAIDTPEGSLRLADFVKKGIEVLENDKGFFFMVESGKIDWACHANDAMTVIQEVLDFDESINIAVEFAKKHPKETLIIVTGDHETGGLTIGQATTGYDTAFQLLENQKMSFVEFDNKLSALRKANPNLTFEQVMQEITANFGLLPPSANTKDNPLALTQSEYKKLQTAFAESKLSAEEQKKRLSEDADIYRLYGGYDPVSVSVTHNLNNKAGIGWTSYSHTGTPVAVHAYGAGAEIFGGSYDNTDVFFKTLEITGITP